MRMFVWLFHNMFDLFEKQSKTQSQTAVSISLERRRNDEWLTFCARSEVLLLGILHVHSHVAEKRKVNVPERWPEDPNHGKMNRTFSPLERRSQHVGYEPRNRSRQCPTRVACGENARKNITFAGHGCSHAGWLRVLQQLNERESVDRTQKTRKQRKYKKSSQYDR